MGIEPFLVASSVRCIIAQRLARVLCTSCRRPIRLSADSVRHAGFTVESDIDAFEAVGCARCGGGGYRGRIGLYEIMPVTPGIRDLTLASASSDQIGATARAGGMRTLRDDAFRKVIRGHTSIDEAIRVLGT
jgi:type IV pilus assembly protein PilB